jgi:hypothetical protein
MACLPGKVLLFVLACGTASAQLNRGTLTGVVSDPTGAAISGARLTAIHQETNTALKTQSTETGNYTLPSLLIGEYRLTVEAAGFKKGVRDAVPVTAGATLRLDVQLELGSLSESVEVTARATALETETTRVGTNITTKLVEDLPLVVGGQIRNVFNLAIIAPETKTANSFRIGGGQGAGWDMLMDGVSLASASANYQNERAPISSVPVDAIQEFTVETTGMKAEYGRAMGFISFETKGGTNRFHGNLFEFVRNNAMDARGFFAARTPISKQHDFGGTVGGPVKIPKIYDGVNRTFFFMSYEGFRYREGNRPSFNTIPLLEMYEGDFRGWTTAAGAMIRIYDPASTRPRAGGGFERDAFPNNMIPKSRFSRVASNYLGLRPAEMAPNLPGPRNNYFRDTGSFTFPWNKGSVRLDHHVNSNNRVSGLYLNGIKEDLASDDPPGLPKPFNGSGVWSRKNSSGRFTWDRTVSARILNSLRTSYQVEEGLITTINSLNPDDKWGERLGILNAPGPDRGMPRITMTEYTQWSNAQWGFDRGRNYNLANDLTYIRGNHTFKMGGFFSKDHWHGGGQHRPNGSFDFSFLATAVPADQSRNTGNAFASFLLGYPGTAGLETPRNVVQIWKYGGGYFQDDWKLTPKLTLNLGIRYEYTWPQTGGAEIDGKLAGYSNFDPNLPNPGSGDRLGAFIFSGQGSGRTGRNTMYNGWPYAISPRIGLAYAARPRTVIRMYAGRGFEAVKTIAGSTHFEGLILNRNWASTDAQVVDFPTLLDRGLPSWQKPPFINPSVGDGLASVAFWQKTDTGRPPQFWTWSFDIQQQVGGSGVLSLGYNATRGVFLTAGLVNLNQTDPKYLEQYGPTLLRANINSAAARAANIPIPYSGFNGTVQRALSAYPQYLTVATHVAGGDRSGNSMYHAMVVKYDKRYSNGLTMLASYALTKMFSNTDTAVESQRVPLDHFNRGLEKALSNDDQTHLSRLAFSYELPVGKGKAYSLGRVSNAFLGGWQVAGFLEYASGAPIGVGPGVNPPIYPGGGGNRVFVSSYDNWRAPVSGEKFDPFKDVWWNRGAFQQVPASWLDSRLGNATRNNPKTRSLPILNENLSLSKNFPVTEQLRLSLRWEAFNMFNRVRFGGPDSTFTSNNFGLVRSQANTPRQMQLALKLIF